MMVRAPNGLVGTVLRRAVMTVALLNLAYFAVEFGVALTAGSVSLFADSIDFLEDASLNALILIAIGWSPKARAYVGMVLSFVLLLPALATVWSIWSKVNALLPPAVIPFTVTGFGALLVNAFCAVWLTRFRDHHGSLTRAAFFSARNDVFANLAMIAAGVVTSFTHSAWPDLAVGIGILLMNADAATKVWRMARDEHQSADSL